MSGTAISMAVAFAGAAIYAWVILAGKVEQNTAATAAGTVLFLSAFIGSWIAANMAEGKKLQTALISGGSFLAILLLITAAFFGGQYNGVWIGVILTLTASLATAMLSLRRGKTGNQKRWKKPYR